MASFLDSSDSSEEDCGNIAANSSSRSNVAYIPSNNNNNANVPSTSTGITSNFRGKLLFFTLVLKSRKKKYKRSNKFNKFMNPLSRIEKIIVIMNWEV